MKVEEKTDASQNEIARQGILGVYRWRSSQACLPRLDGGVAVHYARINRNRFTDSYHGISTFYAQVRGGSRCRLSGRCEATMCVRKDRPADNFKRL